MVFTTMSDLKNKKRSIYSSISSPFFLFIGCLCWKFIETKWVLWIWCLVMFYVWIYLYVKVNAVASYADSACSSHYCKLIFWWFSSILKIPPGITDRLTGLNEHVMDLLMLGVIMKFISQEVSSYKDSDGKTMKKNILKKKYSRNFRWNKTFLVCARVVEI